MILHCWTIVFDEFGIEHPLRERRARTPLYASRLLEAIVALGHGSPLNEFSTDLGTGFAELP